LAVSVVASFIFVTPGPKVHLPKHTVFIFSGYGEEYRDERAYE
jgi:hypothetical protein